MVVAQVVKHKKPYGTRIKVNRIVNDTSIFCSHEPNEETARAIMESMNPANLTMCDSVEDMFEKCGIKC